MRLNFLLAIHQVGCLKNLWVIAVMPLIIPLICQLAILAQLGPNEDRMKTTNNENYIEPVLLGSSTIIICKKCSGVLSGNLKGTGERYCDCPTDFQPKNPEPKGWICPKCGTGLSPYTSKCPCNGPAFGIF